MVEADRRPVGMLRVRGDDVMLGGLWWAQEEPPNPPKPAGLPREGGWGGCLCRGWGAVRKRSGSNDGWYHCAHSIDEETEARPRCTGSKGKS